MRMRAIEDITRQIDEALETEFTFIRSDALAPLIAALAPAEQRFVLDWMRRTASTHTEIAHQFILRAPQALRAQEVHIIEAWVLHAMDLYDREGLRAALEVIRDIDGFLHYSHVRDAGVLFADSGGILQHFVHGLSGRTLKLVAADEAWTDGEHIYLPALLAHFDTREANFQLYKISAVMQWAQVHQNSLQTALATDFSLFGDGARALSAYAQLETLRLGALIGRLLPGLGREMRRLLPDADEPLSAAWREAAQAVRAIDASAQTSLDRLPTLHALPLPEPLPWHAAIHLDAIASAREARIAREKQSLRLRLAEWLREQEAKTQQAAAQAEEDARNLALHAVTQDEAGGMLFELVLDDLPVVPPEPVQRLLTSIHIDFSEIPPEYLTPAGAGEYNAQMDEQMQTSDVWQGTYHEHGALYYNEWDHGRQHYRKNWCVVREQDGVPVYDNFIHDALQRHGGLVAQLRRSFEAMRVEQRLLKRQTEGENVDIDALVEALADAHDGGEMSDRLFVRQQRAERDIAVAFMVDMSGSTRGWINEAEREALLLLCEALERLGDRYAIYGFSGITRKRCEIYRIKRFDESYNDEVQARISGIRAQDYTRMGFAIRHLSGLLNATGARTRLLITLSDGKPDDYSDYRGVYGIEDTRQALLEARRSGIHPFCITLDEEGQDYLPHMYGAVSYTVVSEVRQLPFKVADIYRRLTR